MDFDKYSGWGMAKTMTIKTDNYYGCPVRPVDTGEKVGLIKKLALAPIKKSDQLKSLSENPNIIPLELIKPENIHCLTKVFANGDWIGCTTDKDTVAGLFAKDRKILTLVDDDVNEITFWDKYK